LTIDRPSGLFDLAITYYIPGYNDPETGEYFGDTSWTLFGKQVPSGPSGGTGGFAAEGDTITNSLIGGADPGLTQFELTFSALNTFSGDSTALTWNAFLAAYSMAGETITGTSGIDIIIGGAGPDTIAGLGGNDIIDAGDGADVIDGGAGADLIDGGTGNDTMIGGEGDDVFVVDSAGDVVLELAGGGDDTIMASVTTRIAANVERLVLTGSAPIHGIGDIGDDRITGNDAGNRLRGGGGNDMLFGKGGDDTLEGGNGRDLLDGGTGRDVMRGGPGDDTYVVDSRWDQTIELADQGRDLVQVSGLGAYTLGPNIEDLMTLGVAGFRGTGNERDNQISGGDGDDVLSGRAGNDTISGGRGRDVIIGGAGADVMDGGDGIDTLSYAGASGVGVSVSLADGHGSGGEAQGDLFTGFENLVGSAFDDYLAGDDGVNFIRGGDGSDVIDGRGGNDRLAGGEGTDFFVFDAGSGHDTIIDFIAGAASAEAIRLSVSAAFDTFEEVMAVAHAFGRDGQHTVLRFSADASLTLLNVTKASLVSDDFQW
jgi:Ca2+-binding RTX toxin-like protein